MLLIEGIGGIMVPLDTEHPCSIGWPYCESGSCWSPVVISATSATR